MTNDGLLFPSIALKFSPLPCRALTMVSVLDGDYMLEFMVEVPVAFSFRFTGFLLVWLMTTLS